MSEPTWEWLLVAIAEAKWVCLGRARLRAWALAVDYCVITYDLEVVARCMSSRVIEVALDDYRRRIENVKAFRQARQWMFNQAQQMLRDGHTHDGLRFTKVLPPSLAIPYGNAQRAIRHASRDFDQTVEVIGALNNPTRWGLRHIPTGTAIYFNVLKPIDRMGPEDKHNMVEQAMADLERAVRERPGIETRGSPSADPSPTVN